MIILFIKFYAIKDIPLIFKSKKNNFVFMVFKCIKVRRYGRF
jgi:hypothetical protein